MSIKVKMFIAFIFQFLSVFGTFFCLYLIEPYRQKGNNLFYLFVILGIIFGAISCLVCFYIKKYQTKKITPLVSSIINILSSAFVFTFIIRIVTWVDSDSIFKKTGLISVACIFLFIALILIISLCFEFIKKKDKVVIDKDL